MEPIEKRSTGLTVKIPIELSMRLSKRVCDLRTSGSGITKADLLLHYATRGLSEDQNGESMPVNDLQNNESKQ